jgi:hypothetical protein
VKLSVTPPLVTVATVFPLTTAVLSVAPLPTAVMSMTSPDPNPEMTFAAPSPPDETACYCSVPVPEKVNPPLM